MKHPFTKSQYIDELPRREWQVSRKVRVRLEAYQHQEIEAAGGPAQHMGEKEQMEIFKQSV